jgi:hypothetical protein
VTTTSAYLTLADLAGSEGASATTSRDQRLEAANINRSLLTLGKVIWELGRAKGAGVEGGGGEGLGAHVPFRDSLLTRLLKVSHVAKHKPGAAGDVLATHLPACRCLGTVYKIICLHHPASATAVAFLYYYLLCVTD